MQYTQRTFWYSIIVELVDNSDLTTINRENNTCAVNMARLVSYKVKDDSTYFTFKNKSASVTDNLVTTAKHSTKAKMSGFPEKWRCFLWVCWCCKCSLKKNVHKHNGSQAPLVKTQHDQVKFLWSKFVEKYVLNCRRIFYYLGSDHFRIFL